MDTAPPTRANPYVGPRAFLPGERLYGRDRELLQLIDALIAERIVLLYSRSGAGKTSLIQAALLPELANKKFHVLPVARVSLEPPPEFVLPPAANRYVLSVLLSIEDGLPEAQQLPLAELARLSLAAYLDRRRATIGESGRLMLIFDQFEEILQHPTDQADKEAFFAQVGEVLDDRRDWALFSMREDYVAGLDAFKAALPTRLRATYRLDLLGDSAARLAIREPARQAGVDFDEAAVQKLVNDLRLVRVQQRDGSAAEQLGPYVEPVQLQVVCQSLWDSLPRDVTLVTPERLQAFGDVNQALSGFYERCVKQATQGTHTREDSLRAWFEDILITPAGTRGTVYQGRERTGLIPNAAVQVLEDLHLIRGELRAGARWYELTHDRFIGPIQKSNEAWRALRRGRRQRVVALLFTVLGVLIVGASTLITGGAAQTAGQLGQLQATATAAGEMVATQVQEAAATAVRETAATATAAGRAVATQVQQAAVAATASAVEASQLAVDLSRNRIRPLKPGLSVTGGTIGALARDARGDFYFLVSAVSSDAPGSAVTQPGAIDGGQAPTDTVGFLARSLPLADGVSVAHMVGLARLDERIRMEVSIPGIGPIRGVRDPRPGMSVRKLGRTSGVTVSAIEQIGRELEIFLATDQSIRFVNAVQTGAMSQGGDSGALVVDDEGYAVGVVVAGSTTATIIAPIQDVLDSLGVQLVHIGQELFALRGHARRVLTVAWSPDGRQLASGGDDGAVRVWGALAGSEARLLEGHTRAVRSVAWSPDGARLASGSEDGTIRIWDAGGAVSIRGRGTLLMGRIARGTAEVGDEVVIIGFQDEVLETVITALAISQQAVSQVVAGDEAGILVRGIDVNDVQPGMVLAQPGSFTSHDEALRALEVAGATREAATEPFLMLIEGTSEPIVLNAGADVVHSVAWSPDGARLASGHGDGSVRVWNAADGSLLRTLEGHTDVVNSVAWSPDGARLASGGDDGAAFVWDMTGGDEPKTVKLPQGVSSVAWSPDGRFLAVGSLDGTLHVWEPASQDEPRLLGSHAGSVRNVAWSPDGAQLASASADGTVQIWNVANGEVLFTLAGNTGEVFSAAWSQDGTRLVTANEDGTLRVWQGK